MPRMMSVTLNHIMDMQPGMTQLTRRHRSMAAAAASSLSRRQYHALRRTADAKARGIAQGLISSCV